jgi:hypothetical protein
VSVDLDAIVAGLLADTAALGVWLLSGPKLDEPSEHVLARAVREPSIQPPRITDIENEPLIFGVADHGAYAERIGAAVLVIAFDDRTSLGLIRLRARKAREAIATAVTLGIASRRHNKFEPN